MVHPLLLAVDIASIARFALFIYRQNFDEDGRKGQNRRFPLNAYPQMKRNQDAQLACDLANDKNYVAKAKKLKRLQSKVGYKQVYHVSNSLTKCSYFSL